MLYAFILLFIVLMVIGVPIAFSLGASALIGGLTLWGFGGISVGTLAQRFVSGVNSFTLLAIPLFLLAGQLMNAGGITERIFRFASSIVGHWRGGLAHVNILASLIFSGMSGTAVADVAGMGPMEIKAMEENGYGTDFSAAVTGASALIGPIIPPSVPMVTYSVLAGVSAGALFIGGIVPGLLMAGAQMLTVAYFANRRGYAKRHLPTFREFAGATSRAILPLLAPAIIIGGIWTGVFTPTEAAAVTVIYALLLNLLFYRSMSLADLGRVIRNVALDSAVILVIVGFANIYSYVIVRTQIPMILAEGLFKITRDPFLIMLMIHGLLLVAGCFLSVIVSINLFTPIFIPLIQMVGIDPVFFGVTMVLNLMIGQLTPPFGMVLYLLMKITKLSLGQLTRALLPFMLPVLAVLLLCLFFPQLVIYLPSVLR